MSTVDFLAQLAVQGIYFQSLIFSTNKASALVHGCSMFDLHPMWTSWGVNIIHTLHTDILVYLYMYIIMFDRTDALPPIYIVGRKMYLRPMLQYYFLYSIPTRRLFHVTIECILRYIYTFFCIYLQTSERREALMFTDGHRKRLFFSSLLLLLLLLFTPWKAAQWHGKCEWAEGKKTTHIHTYEKYCLLYLERIVPIYSREIAFTHFSGYRCSNRIDRQNRKYTLRQ